MAKKQTFTSKLNKGGKDFKYVKHIKSVVSEDTGHIKFLHNMVRLEENENLDQALKRMEEESMQGLSFGKPTEDAKEEASAEEASTKETKEEAEPASEEESAEKADDSSDK